MQSWCAAGQTEKKKLPDFVLRVMTQNPPASLCQNKYLALAAGM